MPHSIWDFYSSIDELRDYRKLALEQFISDYNLGRERKRYLRAELPKLPFDDRSFDLVLSGHFLFTYSHKFEFSFILSSIIELFRVCSGEVRIYPLQKSSLDHMNIWQICSVSWKSNMELHIILYQFHLSFRKVAIWCCVWHIKFHELESQKPWY